MRSSLRMTLILATAYSTLWIILARADNDSWIIGVPFVITATLVSHLWLQPTTLHWNFIGLLRFILFFIWQSVRGGFTVARLAYAKSPELQPYMAEYYSHLPDHNSRFFLAITASLLPGTLVVNINENRMLVHVIDSNINLQEELEILEQRLATAFRINRNKHEVGQHG